MNTKKNRTFKKNKNKRNKTKRNTKTERIKTLRFKDYPEFKPNLTPRQIFKLGSFGGTYWRPIFSRITKKDYKNQHKKFPSSWWNGIPEEHLTKSFDKYDTSINKYGEKVGTTLQFWEKKGWIEEQDPYGWIQWYCHFYNGRRTPDDDRQIKRWKSLAGEKGRFSGWLKTQIKKKGGNYKDESISPKIRQTLQHWAYKLTAADFNK
jgi:hypothetical protein